MWHGMWPDMAVYWLWTLWAITWIAASLWANRTVKRPGIAREWIYRVIALAGFFLLLGGFLKTQDHHLIWSRWPGVMGNAAYAPIPVGWAMVAITFLGFAFAWWARIHLGPLWSGGVEAKPGHRVIEGGPYALVRHPIYTGLLAVTAAVATVHANVAAVAGLALVTLGFILKARVEERFLQAELGGYDDYRRRVPMLIPGPWRGIC